MNVSHDFQPFYGACSSNAGLDRINDLQKDEDNQSLSCEFNEPSVYIGNTPILVEENDDVTFNKEEASYGKKIDNFFQNLNEFTSSSTENYNYLKKISTEIYKQIPAPNFEEDDINSESNISEDISKIKKENNPIEIIISLNENNEEIDDCFPFNKGEGLENVFKNFGLEFSWDEKNKKFILSTIKDPKFKIKKFNKCRKYKPDNIKKKIKGKFHKDLKNVINKELKQADSKKLFECFSQDFITNISIKLNKQILNDTFDEIIRQDGFKDNKANENILDKERYEKNLEVLKYLEKNPKISGKSGYDKLKKMKYIELLKAYFSSAEFEKSLVDMYKKKNEKIDYIEEYINKSLSYINFFKNQQEKNSKGYDENNVNNNDDN